ncbi:MAG: sigma 54-interacting transcriptional regulator [Lachnospiraceae bacterium]
MCAVGALWSVYLGSDPDLEMADIRRVIENRENIYSSMVEVRQKQRAIINLIPNIRNGKCEGAILYLYQKTKIDTLDMQLKQKSYERGLYARYHFEDIIGQSEMMETCRFRAKQFARHHANVLILGESGTGKELFAQSIHNFSLRKGNPFVAINCGALPESLLESELFGYVGGAFTGANSKGKKGLIEQADKGTIFLDEIGEMSPEGQVRLLRVLEERTITRIGDDRQIPVNVRIIAATNRNLYQEVQKGKFREDLYYRLNVLTLNIPPLRKRREDIELLANHFLEKYSRENEKHVVLDAGAMEVLKNYPWRGNVRQLRNFCERLVIISDRRVIGRELLQSQIQEIYQQENEEIEETELSTLKSGTSTAESDMVVAERQEQDEETERQRILAELKLCLGNRGETAKNLHMSRATLWRKMKKYGISV